MLTVSIPCRINVLYLHEVQDESGNVVTTLSCEMDTCLQCSSMALYWAHVWSRTPMSPTFRCKAQSQAISLVSLQLARKLANTVWWPLHKQSHRQMSTMGGEVGRPWQQQKGVEKRS